MKTKCCPVIIVTFMMILSVHDAYTQNTVCKIPEVSIISTREDSFNRYVVWFKARGRHLSTNLKIIPTVIHVIYRNRADSQRISRARIQGQINATNKHLRRLNENANETRKIFLPVAADCNIQLCLATKKPDQSCFNGIIYHSYPDFENSDLSEIAAATILDSDKYLNAWVIPDDGSARAVFPWNRTPTGDGIFIGSKVFGIIGADLDPLNKLGAIFTHEAGHYLGLEHPFQNSNNYREQCNLIHDPSIGDFCGDTPLTWEFSLIGESCSEGLRPCSIPPPDFIFAQTENYMDYNPDKCLNMFSKDQRARMRACLSSLRLELASSSNLAFTGVKGGDCKGMETDKQALEKKIAVFPNPTNGIVHFAYYDKNVKNISIKVYSQAGQPFKEVNSRTAISQLDLSSFPEGVYYIKVITGDTILTKYIFKNGPGNISTSSHKKSL